MASVEQRLQLKREPLDKWSVREQLCLAAAVARSGDQNWMSVSRALKPFAEPNRPSDWFHQKNCAAQYGALLANVETPKRKKRLTTGDIGIETPAESILRRLKEERALELEKLLHEEKTEFLKLHEELILLQSGKVTEEQLDKFCKEIEEEESLKDQETLQHSQWLKEREARKQEIERAWRPAKPPTPTLGSKRKHSDSIETLIEVEHVEDYIPNPQESPKPALSPLLTSLLKSPSQVQNVNTSSILHSAITSHRPTNTNTNPMIASLLSSTTNVSVSPGLQQLVSSAIGQGQEPVMYTMDSQIPVQDEHPLATPDMLDDDSLQNLKIEDIANSIIVQDGPLPEMKNDVDVIISDLIADPEQHLELDNNGDISINLELDDLDDTDIVPMELKDEILDNLEKEKAMQKSVPEIPEIDPFEFQEDPIVFEPKLPSLSSKQYEFSKSINLDTSLNVEEKLETEVRSQEDIRDEIKELGAQFETVSQEVPKAETDNTVPGSVEIVEVGTIEEEEIVKEFNQTEIQDIVHSSTVESLVMKPAEPEPETVTPTTVEMKDETVEKLFEEPLETLNEVPVKEPEVEVKQNISLDMNESNTESNTLVPDYDQELYDDISMEVKVDKSGKAKRDYSRTKKKEDKGFDMLLAIEKAQLEDGDLIEESLSDKEFLDIDKKDKFKIKNEIDRSNSPWTEEEDITGLRLKRRFSTPTDSIPNSPASSNAYFEDDRDYRTWKKAVMLVYSRLAAHKYSSLFLKPITEDQAPGYHELIYRPMDFHTIRKNIENGTIKTTHEFKRDVMLMLNNAIMYNKSYSSVYKMTIEIQQEAVESFQLLMQAQSLVDAPMRRETRTSEPGLKRKRPNEDNTKNKKRKED